MGTLKFLPIFQFYFNLIDDYIYPATNLHVNSIFLFDCIIWQSTLMMNNLRSGIVYGISFLYITLRVKADKLTLN